MRSKIIFLIILTLFLIGCSNNSELIVSKEIPEWMKINLKDIKTNEAFNLGEFDKPVLLESFAVWCPTCKKQQNILKQFHEAKGDYFISVSVDTDPNEDRELVLDHINKNNFDWHYVISQSTFTQRLIDEFGLGIVNAPRVPMILICPDKSYKELKSGVKNAAYLDMVVSGCKS